MENPATWNDVQKLIDKTIWNYEKNTAEGIIGFSLTTTIYNALVGAHMIKDEFCMIQPQKSKAIVMGEEGVPKKQAGEIEEDSIQVAGTGIASGDEKNIGRIK